MAARFPEFVHAYAKINLTLDVLGKRQDGYHRLASVMQTIALADMLALTPRDDATVDCVCDLPEIQMEANLALRAAHLLRSTGYTGPGLTVELSKGIPLQAGLGGGSSDGAAVLSALNQLWQLDLDTRRLEQLAAALGSDVPFFIHGGTALIEGRGEVVHPLPDAEPLWIVLAKPAISLPTSEVFSALRSEEWSDGGATVAVVAAVRSGLAIPLDRLFNALEPGVYRSFPAVVAARQALLDAGAPVVRMSGSGPTLFAPFRQLVEAMEVARRARRDDLVIWLTHTTARAAVRYAWHNESI